MSIFNQVMRPISLLGTVVATWNFGSAVSSFTQTCLSSAHQGCEEAERNLMQCVCHTMVLLSALCATFQLKRLSLNREQSN